MVSRVLTGFRKREYASLDSLFENEFKRLLEQSLVATYLLGEVATRPMQFATPFGETMKALRRIASVGSLSRLQSIQAILAGKAAIIAGETSAAVQDELRAFVDDLILQGTHVGPGVKALQAKFATLGLTGPANRLEAIFRTQNQLAYGAGQWATYSDPDIQEILWGFEYVTVGDDRVRPSHAALDGTRYPKDHGFWQTHFPPNGWNCRCQVIPIFDEGRERDPKTLPDGSDPQPDRGFEFNPGEWATIAASFAWEDFLALVL